MPTYDYVCQNCGHTFEKFQSITADPAKKCPECGKMKLNRLIGSGAGIIFKGSGFYETDYRSTGYKQAQKKDTDASKSSKGSGDSKKETAAKKETPTPKSDNGGKAKKKTA